MKLLFTLGFIISSVIFNTARANPDTDNETIFDFPITTLSGDTFTLGEFKNRQPVYLKFWATWCQPCRKEMPHLQHTFEEYGDNIKIVAVNLGINEDMDAIDATMLEFGLTLPITIDSSGKLSKAFNMIGTPYHVLIDKDGNVVHHGHKASKELDRKLAQLSDRQAIDLPSAPLQHAESQSLDLNQQTDEISALFFLSTWCDWYLKDTRPTMSANCTNAQNLVNLLYKDNPQLNWRGIASRLWTSNKELDTYKDKHRIEYPLVIDASDDTFIEYGVKSLPTLVLTKNGSEIFRATDFSDPATIAAAVKKFIEQ